VGDEQVVSVIREPHHALPGTAVLGSQRLESVVDAAVQHRQPLPSAERAVRAVARRPTDGPVDRREDLRRRRRVPGSRRARSHVPPGWTSPADGPGRRQDRRNRIRATIPIHRSQPGGDLGRAVTQLPGPAPGDFPLPSPDRRPLDYGEIRRGSATHGRDLPDTAPAGPRTAHPARHEGPGTQARTGDPCDAAGDRAGPGHPAQGVTAR
jgi:hypothetical protein